MRQAEFARRVGVNRQLVGNWLNGSTPDGENYARAIRVMYPDRGELNDALWLECTVAIEEELAKRGLSLPPATKLRLAQSFYKHFQRSDIAADAAFIGDVIGAWNNDDPNDKNKRG